MLSCHQAVTFETQLPFLVSNWPTRIINVHVAFWIFLRVCFKPETKYNVCWCTYPVHLHVLKFETKVIALYEVAPQENLGEEGLSKSFWLKETTGEKGVIIFITEHTRQKSTEDTSYKNKYENTTGQKKQVTALC